jgi:hypothetical protein
VKIGEVLNAVYDADVGWRPASGGIKPAHVANGLVRALQGATHDTRRLHEFVVWWSAGKKPNDERSYEALTKAHPDLYAAFALSKDARTFDRLRRYVCGLLGEAVFPSVDNSSFSLTSGSMVTRDPNDRRLGLFGAALVGAKEDKDSLAAAIVSAATADAPRDPLTALVWPLLDPEPKAYGGSRDEMVRKALARPHNKAFIDAISDAARCLATHERAQGNPMRTLQRAVQFVCVATQAHAQALAAGGRLDDRPPALLTFTGHKQSDVAIASERSLELIFQRFEAWLATRLSELIKKRKPLMDGEEPLVAETTDARSVRAVLAAIGSAKKGQDAPDPAVVKERVHYFVRARQLDAAAEPAELLARALVDAYSREFASGGPRKFLRVLGCRAGLLYPHFSGASRDKRVRPSVPVLDMIVRACVPAGKSVPLDDFLERLWRRFGLIVGGRRDDRWDDAAFLADRNLPIDTPELLENQERLIEELVAMGLARRYADDVTFVGDA